jgi:hypothetical protein
VAQIRQMNDRKAEDDINNSEVSGNPGLADVDNNTLITSGNLGLVDDDGDNEVEGLSPIANDNNSDDELVIGKEESDVYSGKNSESVTVLLLRELTKLCS